MGISIIRRSLKKFGNGENEIKKKLITAVPDTNVEYFDELILEASALKFRILQMI